ncbi:MAG: polymer-forming cytoskeletal protein [Chitinophagaceae bacterium]|jgi:cytoskeletal protein CcmA (bactofilin family)|nr:polymer-forming cytoskeletal protein [Chitinophagaceae bacterium]OQY92116.1 MAG: cell shape determination protein CcmA [Sphingobacteriales bacterium UTBCD1]
MFNTKQKTDMLPEKTNGGGNGTTLIGAGTTLKGDISSNNDLRIDGTIVGNINCASKIVIGANGIVEGDITGNQADIVGKVSGNIRAKDLLQLRGDCVVSGDLYAGKLQVEPSATFNGQCHMGANVVGMSNDKEQQAAAIS